jgi:hypothetical protein
MLIFHFFYYGALRLIDLALTLFCDHYHSRVCDCESSISVNSMVIAHLQSGNFTFSSIIVFFDLSVSAYFNVLKENRIVAKAKSFNFSAGTIIDPLLSLPLHP